MRWKMSKLLLYNDSTVVNGLEQQFQVRFLETDTFDFIIHPSLFLSILLFGYSISFFFEESYVTLKSIFNSMVKFTPLDGFMCEMCVWMWWGDKWNWIVKEGGECVSFLFSVCKFDEIVSIHIHNLTFPSSNSLTLVLCHANHHSSLMRRDWTKHKQLNWNDSSFYLNSTEFKLNSRTNTISVLFSSFSIVIVRVWGWCWNGFQPFFPQVDCQGYVVNITIEFLWRLFHSYSFHILFL